MLSGNILNGYIHVHLSRNGFQQKKFLHVLICTAFHGPKPKGKQVRHLDGKSLNNRADNLTWGTKKEDAADQARHGTRPDFRGDRNPAALMTWVLVHKIRAAHRKLIVNKKATNGTYARLAELFGVSEAAVKRATSKRYWRS